MKRLSVLFAILLSACAVNLKPKPTPVKDIAWQLFTHVCSSDPCVSGNEPNKLPGAIVSFNQGVPSGVADGAGNYVNMLRPDTYRVCADFPGYTEACADVTLPPGQDLFLKLTQAVPSRTRAQVINIKTGGMQGLTIVTHQFGQLPWWDAAIAWLDEPADRQAVYALKLRNGDTHQLIQLPFGPPLYNEEGNAYAPSKGFGGRDWTGDYSKLVALVDEVNAAGLVPVIFLGGDGTDGYPIAQRQLPQVIAALGHDRMMSLILTQGWDGVFYGWEPVSKITDFGAQFRSLCPDCYLAIEMGAGHIPLGEGPTDWCPTCRMKDYDTLLIEYDPDNPHQDSTWQINGRLFGPRYIRPSDQPKNDDPNPPFYLSAGTSRGPVAAIPFEVTTYYWVRGLSQAQNDARVNYVMSTVRK
jgi:hypothetical protein